jgi:hypothetical protein
MRIRDPECEIRDGKNSGPGFGKHPGSATLGTNIIQLENSSYVLLIFAYYTNDNQSRLAATTKVSNYLIYLYCNT